MTEDEMAGWHHQLDGREFEWTPGVGDGQGGLACCNSWVAKSRTRLSDWTDLNWGDSEGHGSLMCCSSWGCRVRYNWASEQQLVAEHILPSKLQDFFLFLYVRTRLALMSRLKRNLILKKREGTGPGIQAGFHFLYFVFHIVFNFVSCLKFL